MKFFGFINRLLEILLKYLSKKPDNLNKKEKDGIGSDYSLSIIDEVIKPRFKIGISPGHGGDDTGAKGKIITEAELARKLSEKIYEEFNANPIFNVVVHDPGINRPKNYAQRVKNSDTRKEDYYIPVHLNSWSNPKTNGWLVFADPNDVQKNKGLEELCLTVLGYLNSTYKLGWRDWDDKRDGFMVGIGRKVYEQYKPQAQTVYLELGFISNPEWEQELLKEETQEKIAKAVVSAFTSFLGVGNGS